MGSSPGSPSADTKTRILDAAERLFGRYGMDATSLRQITAEAGVNLAAVNYHFQSKDALIAACLDRRIGPINRRRIELLEEAEARGNPTVEEILLAFVSPLFGAQGIRTAKPMIGHMFSAPQEFEERVWEKHLKLISYRFRDALHRTLPHLNQEELLWRFVFLVGSMVHAMAFGPVLPVMTNGICDPADEQKLLDHYVRFIAAGLRAPGKQES
jgi:AcrR family transcriptional regulator